MRTYADAGCSFGMADKIAGSDGRNNCLESIARRTQMAAESLVCLILLSS